MIIDCVADLHGHYPKLEGGDLLIVAGDLTAREGTSEQMEFLSWVQNQKYTSKVFIAGNHDNWLTGLSHDKFSLFGVTYLCDSGTEFTYYIDGLPDEDEKFLPSGKRTLKIWGSPWTLTFPGINPNCTAFTGDEELLTEKFALIPGDIDILVTHGPPCMIMDEVKWYDFDHNSHIENVGSKSLSKRVHGINPKLHIFGHIHERYGTFEGLMIKFINCSHVNERYEPVNKPIRIIL